MNTKFTLTTLFLTTSLALTACGSTTNTVETEATSVPTPTAKQITPIFNIPSQARKLCNREGVMVSFDKPPDGIIPGYLVDSRTDITSTAYISSENLGILINEMIALGATNKEIDILMRFIEFHETKHFCTSQEFFKLQNKSSAGIEAVIGANAFGNGKQYAALAEGLNNWAAFYDLNPNDQIVATALLNNYSNVPYQSATKLLFELEKRYPDLISPLKELFNRNYNDPTDYKEISKEKTEAFWKTITGNRDPMSPVDESIISKLPESIKAQLPQNPNYLELVTFTMENLQYKNPQLSLVNDEQQNNEIILEDNETRIKDTLKLFDLILNGFEERATQEIPHFISSSLSPRYNLPYAATIGGNTYAIRGPKDLQTTYLRNPSEIFSLQLTAKQLTRLKKGTLDLNYMIEARK